MIAPLSHSGPPNSEARVMYARYILSRSPWWSAYWSTGM